MNLSLSPKCINKYAHDSNVPGINVPGSNVPVSNLPSISHSKSLIKDMTSSDLFKDSFKPDYYPYLVTKQKFRIRDNFDKIIFFENTLENLETAYKLGWVTVYIEDGIKIKRKPYYVHHKFNTIHDN